MDTVKPLTNTAFDTYVDWYGEVAVPAMERSGFDIVGAWKRTGGRMGQDVLLVRFESLAAFESASNALWKDAGLQKGLTSMREGLDVAEEVRLADAVPYATEERLRAARNLSYLRQVKSGKTIHINALRLGPARVVYMPGELFVEYQLAAQTMRPGEFVAMAAYGDYGPGYIGTTIAYGQGGYETGIVSRTAPQVEEVLMQTLQELLSD